MPPKITAPGEQGFPGPRDANQTQRNGAASTPTSPRQLPSGKEANASFDTRETSHEAAREDEFSFILVQGEAAPLFSKCGGPSTSASLTAADSNHRGV